VLRPRALGAAQRERAVAEARSFLGRRYDPRFGWGDDRIYCSELVVKAYQRGAGVSLGRRERVGDLRLFGVEAAMARRWGGEVPRDLVLVSPASVAEDARLRQVYLGR
jgi:cell wall-associated NlpC family hydrolase